MRKWIAIVLFLLPALSFGWPAPTPAPDPDDLSYTPGLLDFGTVAIRETKDLTITLINAGEVELTGALSALDAPFSYVGSYSFTIAGGGSEDITVRYSPTASTFDIVETVITVDGSEAGRIIIGGNSDQYRPLLYNKTLGRYTYVETLRANTEYKNRVYDLIVEGDVEVLGSVRARRFIDRFSRQVDGITTTAITWTLDETEIEPPATDIPQATADPDPIIWGRVAYLSGGKYEEGINGVSVVADGVATSVSQTVDSVDGMFAIKVPWNWSGWIYAQSNASNIVQTPPYYMVKVIQDYNVGFGVVEETPSLSFNPILNYATQTPNPTNIPTSLDDLVTATPYPTPTATGEPLVAVRIGGVWYRAPFSAFEAPVPDPIVPGDGTQGITGDLAVTGTGTFANASATRLGAGGAHNASWPLYVTGNAYSTSNFYAAAGFLTAGNGFGTTNVNQNLKVGTYGWTAAGEAIRLFPQTFSNSSGDAVAVKIMPTYNQSGTAASYDLKIDRTETATGSGSKYLVWAGVGGSRQFSVTNAGIVWNPQTQNYSNLTGLTYPYSTTADIKHRVWNDAYGFDFQDSSGASKAYIAAADGAAQFDGTATAQRFLHGSATAKVHWLMPYPLMVHERGAAAGELAPFSLATGDAAGYAIKLELDHAYTMPLNQRFKNISAMRVHWTYAGATNCYLRVGINVLSGETLGTAALTVYTGSTASRSGTGGDSATVDITDVAFDETAAYLIYVKLFGDALTNGASLHKIGIEYTE